MAQAINTGEAIDKVNIMVEDGWERQQIFEYFIEQEGFSKKQVLDIFLKSGLTTNEKLKRDLRMNQTGRNENNPMEDALGGLLTLAITYGLPLLLMLFGLAYVWGEISRDLDVGIRSAAAAIMPLAITLAFAKSTARHNAANFLSDNKFIAFAFSFALAMIAAAAAMYMRELNNVIPVGELAFSTTLALMIFGKKTDGEVSLVHVGAVSGLLTYVIFFGVGV